MSFSRTTGQVTKIGEISGGKRALAALDADFTRERKVVLSFNDLALPDGRHFQLQTSVTPGSGQVMRFVAAAESKEKKGVRMRLPKKPNRPRNKSSRSGT